MDVLQKTWQWRSQTWVLLSLGLAIIIVALVVSYALSAFKPTTSVKIGQSGIYSLWVADTDAGLYQGLSGIENLPSNGGLLMDFKAPGKHGIVMRGMLVPLDIIWLDEAKAVVHMSTNVPSDTDPLEEFKPNKPARYVLELPAGSVRKSAIKIGDVADFEVNGGSI